MSVHQDLAHASIAELSGLLARRELSPIELLDTYLTRIEALEPRLHCFVEVMADSAREQAGHSQARIARGDARPLEGIPIAIKDIVMIAGCRLGMGSRLSPPFPMPEDSEVVARLRAAGPVLLGRTTLPEFGTIPSTEGETVGATHNPWSLDHSPGGSSGGSAVAVAAGLAPAAHGADGGGSLRVPASNCGLFTLKPTRGRISCGPLHDGFGLVTDGFLTHTVADNARLLDAVLGAVVGDFYWSPAPRGPLAAEADRHPGRLRIAWTASPPVEVDVHPACGAAVEAAAALCAELGHEVVEATPDWRDPSLVGNFLQVWSALTGSGMDMLVSLGGGSVADAEPHNRALHAMAQGIDGNQLATALAGGQAYARKVLGHWRTYDVLLTPTLAEPPWKLGEFFAGAESEPLMPIMRATPTVAFTAVFNVTGQPAVSLPLSSHEGLPIGVMATARLGDDLTLLQLSHQIEEARPWAGRRPPLD